MGQQPPVNEVEQEQQGGEEEKNTQGAARLSPTPRDDLFVLGHELELGIGIGGRKATKLFSSREQGLYGYKYVAQNIVWDRISEMIQAGHTGQTPAIDVLIYDIYDCNKPVSKIINEMQQQRHIKLT